ncbi:MAG: hypothetical protein L3J65_10835 [Robiginitomaculum sp.]|nr:hypothetical protein [Robiginitomaculum sp.]
MGNHQGRLIAALSAQFRNIDLAEDVLQDALAVALISWPKKGVPHDPKGWLYQTAKRKAIDRYRRRTTRRDKSGALAYQTHLNIMTDDDIINGEIDAEQNLPDERLGLIFACCHPALPALAHTALTLKTVCGLSTPQIAAAFLVSETTMAQRIVRAKNKIKKAGIPFVVPDAGLWTERWKSVLGVVYLIFNAGYSSLDQDKDVDLCAEAIRLGRILVKLLPDEAEAAGLLALMLLTHARRPARLASPDIYISLEEQNRNLWDKGKISEGQDLLLKTLTKGRPDVYQIQAAISAVHCQAASFVDTDWQEITVLYERLYAYEPTPIVLLNASVALSFAQGPAAGLASLEPVSQNAKLDNYQPYHAARADMLRRDGRFVDAQKSYKQAIALSRSATEQEYLAVKMASMKL